MTSDLSRAPLLAIERNIPRIWSGSGLAWIRGDLLSLQTEEAPIPKTGGLQDCSVPGVC